MNIAMSGEAELFSFSQFYIYFEPMKQKNTLEINIHGIFWKIVKMLVFYH